MIKPLNGHIFVTAEEVEKKTESGIIIDISSERVEPSQGIVQYAEDTTLIGKKVLWPQFAGGIATVNHKKFHVLGTENLIAILE